MNTSGSADRFLADLRGRASGRTVTFSQEYAANPAGSTYERDDPSVGMAADQGFGLVTQNPRSTQSSPHTTSLLSTGGIAFYVPFVVRLYGGAAGTQQAVANTGNPYHTKLLDLRVAKRVQNAATGEVLTAYNGGNIAMIAPVSLGSLADNAVARSGIHNDSTCFATAGTAGPRITTTGTNPEVEAFFLVGRPVHVSQ